MLYVLQALQKKYPLYSTHFFWEDENKIKYINISFSDGNYENIKLSEFESYYKSVEQDIISWEKWVKVWKCVEDLFNQTSFMDQKFKLYGYAISKNLPVDDIGITEEKYNELVLWWDRLRRVANDKYSNFNIDNYHIEEITPNNERIFGKCPIEKSI